MTRVLRKIDAGGIFVPSLQHVDSIFFWLQYDSSIPHTDIWKAFEKLVEKGLVKSIGVSNFSSKQIKNILEVATVTSLTF